MEKLSEKIFWIGRIGINEKKIGMTKPISQKIASVEKKVSKEIQVGVKKVQREKK